MANISELQDFDNFFYYGLLHLEQEIQSDILQNIMQPEGSLYYSRHLNSCGLDKWENQPNGFTLKFNMPYQIITSLSKRNQYVSAGDQYPDRRVAVSQNTIILKQSKENIDLMIYYIQLSNLKVVELQNIAIGV